MYISKISKSAMWKRLPDLIKNATPIQKYKKIQKIFPSIGLQNSFENLDTSKISELDLAKIGLNREKKYSIVFSSNNITGCWDIATMAMRGTGSCQHWNNHHAIHLIGSIIDPFCGIIYLTDGEKTNYGPRMIKRCIVRFVQENDTDVYDRTGSKYSLFIERLYKTTNSRSNDPYDYSNKEIDPGPSISLFSNFLKNRAAFVSNIKSSHNGTLHGFSYSIPLANEVENLHPANRSLVDSGIPYRTETFAKLIKKNQQFSYLNQA